MKKWGFAILCLIIDQLAKGFAIQSNNYVINRSTSLSILKLNNNFLIFVCIILLIIFFVVYVRINSSFRNILPLLVIVGASNLIDRLFRGGVVDIFKISILPIFNISDLIITTIFVFLFANYVNNQFKSRKKR
jgi:lipoprotein signal peptidase